MDQTDKKRRKWCSTKVDGSGFHESGGGNWGYCRPDCKGLTYENTNEYVQITTNQPKTISQDYFEGPSTTELTSKTKKTISGKHIIL